MIVCVITWLKMVIIDKLYRVALSTTGLPS